MRNSSHQVFQVSGVPGPGAWAYWALSLLKRPPASLSGLPEQLPEPLILVREKEQDLEDIADALQALKPLFPQLPLSYAFFGEDPQMRWGSLEKLHRGVRIVLASRAALETSAPTAAEYSKLRFTLSKGSAWPREQLLQRLAALGYERVDFVENPAEFAVRGAVVDFFTLEPLQAVRILYDGDRIESVRIFNAQSQSTLPQPLEEAIAVPACESGFSLALSQRLFEQGTWVVEEGVEIATGKAPCLRVVLAAQGSDFGASPCPVFAGNLAAVAEQCRHWHSRGMRILFFVMNSGERERIEELWEDRIPQGAVQFLIGPLRQGFIYAKDALVVLASAEIFNRFWRPSRGWKAAFSQRARVRLGELKKGDYVVHDFYGIARYLGLEAVATAQSVTDCLKLEFRGGDALYVPMTDFKQVQKYIGSQGHRPRLSSLDRRSWGEIKARVEEGVRELAERLIKTEASRAALPGYAFPPDSHIEREFAASFPFEETPDQSRAIEEVLSDMRAPHPMDRLVLGDVGFGKTEVAMRAALKCALGLRQAALLVPTTILADQHARTFRKRFAEYPVRIELLSRFQSRLEQRRTIEDLASGKVDIVIGTHRLLQGDVRFKDLGLLIIDEEQRFGVRDKEKLKELKKEVDCLALSATPIPRTLQQGLSGLKRVSIIRSAPAGRQPVLTTVRPFDEGHVALAIQQELARGGQVFYVHNKVRTLPQRVDFLKARLPNLRVAMAHGQMSSQALEKTMWDFFSRKYDVLVASSIIESGLDIPSVNTLLVENAQDFGLAQLYQLRGRIGRERERAYCTLYYPPREEEWQNLSTEARQRLNALREFGELGSGLALALRDLEIRGAGDLLGAKQHGFLNAVGAEFYCRLLEAEVQRLQGRPAAHAPEIEPTQLDVGVPAYIPSSYLPGDLERIEFYKRMLACDEKGLDALKRELTDISGPLPETVANLFRIMAVRGQASSLGIRAIVQRGSQVEIYFRPSAHIPEARIKRWLSVYPRGVEFLRESAGDGVRILLGEENALAWIEEFLSGF